MNRWVTKVRGDGTPAVDGMNAFEALSHLIKSFIPLETLPTVRSATDGILEPIFVVVKISQGSGLRADVTLAERVVFVTTDVETLVGLNSDFDAAYRLAEIAGAIVRGTIVGGSHGTVQICVICG